MIYNSGDYGSTDYYRVHLAYVILTRQIRTGRFVRKWYAKRFPHLVREETICTKANWEIVKSVDPRAFFL